jgi:hypothetical protein
MGSGSSVDPSHTDVLPDATAGEPVRHESEAERVDRNLGELRQELRVASIGVQVLFGFLLSLPFSARFIKLDAAQRSLYIAALLLAALSTALLIAPVAYHRLVFRRHEKERLLRTANRLALAGLTTVAFAVIASVVLVVSVVWHGALMAVLAALTATAFVALWVVLPLQGRRAGSPPVNAGGAPDRENGTSDRLQPPAHPGW